MIRIQFKATGSTALVFSDDAGAGKRMRILGDFARIRRPRERASAAHQVATQLGVGRDNVRKDLQYAEPATYMDGRGRALDNAFNERLWRSVKYEDIYLKDYNGADE